MNNTCNMLRTAPSTEEKDKTSTAIIFNIIKNSIDYSPHSSVLCDKNMQILENRADEGLQSNASALLWTVPSWLPQAGQAAGSLYSLSWKKCPKR